uniref:DOMON domain-containing protein n=1 Tax=Kalanchoe fedtschenkoi TaxID=63787 RepID=A0A7N0UGJ4_KALFE
VNKKVLDAELHYTYNATNGSLSVAFVATPPEPSGWTSWAVNPTGTGMIGAQAFVAFQVNGTVRTKTLNITGYKEIKPGNLSFAFWDVSAEKKNDVLTLYASLAVPGNKTFVNQVWNVGPGLADDGSGKLKPHALTGESLMSKSALSLTGAPVPTAAPAPSTPAPGNSTNTTSGTLGRMKMSGGFDLSLMSAFMASMVILCLF